MVIRYRRTRASCWSVRLGAASVMRTGWLRGCRLADWLEATGVLPWTGRGMAAVVGGARPRSPGSAAHRATRWCTMQATAAALPEAPVSCSRAVGGGLGGLGRLLHRLLVAAYLRQRLRAGDVGDRAAGALLAVLPCPLAPSGRRDPALLPQQGQEDLRLLRPAAGQAAEAAQQGPAVRDVGPHGLGPPVVLLDQETGELLGAGGHRAGVPVQRRRALEVPQQHRGIAIGELGGRQAVDAHPLRQQARRPEGAPSGTAGPAACRSAARGGRG